MNFHATTLVFMENFMFKRLLLKKCNTVITVVAKRQKQLLQVDFTTVFEAFLNCLLATTGVCINEATTVFDAFYNLMLQHM